MVRIPLKRQTHFSTATEAFVKGSFIKCSQRNATAQRSSSHNVCMVTERLKSSHAIN